ncbi:MULTISPECIES: TolC family outer membrane protein [unclassified Pseudomonas]|uniref:TolC family outer membrane protein n=1 Tax=unclassified Pseudomonas TaxID=196821 RepID=UPI000BD2AE8D|nr:MULTISPECIES: TolC family outer membrane protein [unclassified Pseudomonas]PVZ09258.1 adhesin transport system outer membrane protein [Pseudomonas sp. URIL14HWK12:I12]PVZ21297.1 adhesin transport system outer membrane protein [Pseudomonas sp. URIL14HWK12:I10]PVZ30150.1 adhesin transport system outer membrane protein [Pseudomonas sp. URIL14HWK12:I11]SNZ18686.1 outer membrane protein, adhesin transport system [Pseudomonas sp. URIL14HWK12:I9]
MRVFTPLCSAVLLAMSAGSLHAMTLQQAIQATVDNHPELQSNLNARLAADEDAKVARGAYFPTVDLVGGWGRERSDTPTTRAQGNHNKETLNYTQSELRLRQMLFDGSNTSREVERTRSVSTSRAYYAQGVAQDLALRAVEVYLQVLQRREEVALARNNLQAHQRVNDQIGLRTERGVGSSADSDQSRARVALAQNNYQTAMVDLADAESNFYSAVGQMPDQLEEPASIIGELPAGLEQARQAMQENNPYLKSAQADVQSAEQQYEGAKSQFYPRVDAEVAVGANNNISGEEGHANDWRAGVAVSYNLFRGGSDKARLQGDAHRINQAMDIRNNALRTLNENMSLAWHAMENARIQTPVAREYAQTSTRVRSAYQDQFGLGQRTLLDVLDSENELYNANRRFVEVRYTEEYSMYRVLANMGELLPKTRIVLPPEAVANTEVRSEARLPGLR